MIEYAVLTLASEMMRPDADSGILPSTVKKRSERRLRPDAGTIPSAGGAKAMPVDLSLQRFRFYLEAKAPLRMPAYNKGNVIRGGFGSAFRRMVCHAGCQVAETCELRNVCPYTTVFQPFVPEGSDKISKNRDIPRPFVIKPPLETKEIYLSGERLSFDVVLIGKIRDYLPYFIVTFKELAHMGLGRDRTPLELVSVESLGINGDKARVYGRETNLVQPPREALSWERIAHSDGHNTTMDDARRITLRFLTPTMLKVDGTVTQKPTFGTIFKRLRDRINALAYFYCGKGLEIDFKALGMEADKICTAQASVRWVQSGRYSRRRQVNHDLSGFVGEITFTGELAPFLPYLRLGGYVHVGKNAVFGNGWYEILSEE
jgi:hypothetical protein